METLSTLILLLILCSIVHCQEDPFNTKKSLSILIISNPFPGHLMPPSILGEELVRRGHNVTLCTTPMSGSNLAQKLTDNARMKFINAGDGYLTYYDFQRVFAAGIGNSTKNDRWKVFNIHPDTSIKMGKFLDRDNLTEYDLIVATEKLAPVLACLSKRWNIPGIVLGTTHQHQFHLLPEWSFPPFYANKRGRIRISDDMTFSERMRGFLYVEYNKLYNRFYKSRYEFVCPDPVVDYSYMSTYLGIRAPHIIPTALLVLSTHEQYLLSLTMLVHFSVRNCQAICTSG